MGISLVNVNNCAALKAVFDYFCNGKNPATFIHLRL